MNENRFKNGNVCQSCGASIPYGSFICKNCNSPLRLEQVNNNMNNINKTVTKRDRSGLLVPTLLIVSVILIIITIALVVYFK